MGKHTEMPPQRMSRVGKAWSGLRRALTSWMNIPLKQSGIHLVTLALAVLTISLLINFINQVIQSATLEARRVELLAEVEQLEAENIHIRGAAEYAESDVHVERVAREQLGYAREGDMVILPQFALPKPTPPPEALAPSPLPQTQAQPNWQGWWEAFVDISE
jgi:cell division protein FtsB